jgi:hypothetical protein
MLRSTHGNQGDAKTSRHRRDSMEPRHVHDDDKLASITPSHCAYPLEIHA